MSGMNHDLGLYHDNNPVGESREWERGSIEKHRPWKIGLFPLHSIYFHQNQTPVVDISLSDGGHSDNLGIYSLLKRGCQNLLSVDAEYDPNYNFSLLKILSKKTTRPKH